MKRAPIYLQIVDTYDLEILKRAADFLLTESGDLTLTPYGDLKIGDNRFSAMRSLKMAVQRPDA